MTTTGLSCPNPRRERPSSAAPFGFPDVDPYLENEKAFPSGVGQRYTLTVDLPGPIDNGFKFSNDTIVHPFEHTSRVSHGAVDVAASKVEPRGLELAFASRSICSPRMIHQIR